MLSDSTMALHWIYGNSDRWQQFVRNRVSKIQHLMDKCMWRHCPGNDNLGEFLIRGIPAAQLSTNVLWWNEAP
ncbi:hypothetical protein HPB48_018960 [Haemaphysalis longicornis]|uniref:Uncharacterized protein n=1 Tax=Haemaphysalis longicornis TaxID=44386 RepID=A0A9J6GYM4_HAELO|nr:hypothetical protein HPB48_018960 [Haemaphysalis longicornis]